MEQGATKNRKSRMAGYASRTKSLTWLPHLRGERLLSARTIN